MINKFEHLSHLLNSPAIGGINVTPADTPLDQVVRQIRVTVAGVVKVTLIDGSVLLAAFSAGESRAMQVTQIWATGTTATGIEGMY